MNPKILLLKEQPYYQRFESLLKEIGAELAKLSEENKVLLQENEELRDKLNHFQNGQPGIFSHLSESERRAFRAEISEMIARVDKHIAD